MRVRPLLTLAALLGGLTLHAADAGGPKFASVNIMDAQRELAGLTRVDTPAAMWIWSDKYVYQPGEQLTLRWTLKPNGDLLPYTIVAYRQNNQTGEKFYMPGGTGVATDIFGNTVDQGFDIVRLPAAEKAVVLGAGGMFPAVTIPNELGMHTLVVQLRDYTGTRIIKSAYWKIGVVDGFEPLTGDITGETNLVNTKAYNLSGVVLVHDGGVLNIEAGTFVIGQPGSQPPSAIVVGNTGRIEAKGSRSRPIIMTSSLPFGQRHGGDWGGLVLLGRAPTNWPNGVGNIEGLPPDPSTEYGGTDPTHNCGTLQYVRLEFAGAELRPNDEINAFTFGACGTGTTVDHLDSTYGLDDSFEWFGGTMNASYLVSTYPRDDHFDSQIGFTGKTQYFIGVGNLDDTNRGFEIDDNENDFGAVPLNKPTYYNGTLVGVGDTFQEGVDEGTVAGMYLRRGAGGSFNNIIIQNWVDGAININDDATQAHLGVDLTMNGILMWKNGVASGAENTIAGQTSELGQAYVTTQAPNILVADPMLKNPMEYSNPNFMPGPGSPVFRANWVQPPDDGVLDQSATFIGAMGDVDWTEEWTNFIQEQDMAVQ